MFGALRSVRACLCSPGNAKTITPVLQVRDSTYKVNLHYQLHTTLSPLDQWPFLFDNNDTNYVKYFNSERAEIFSKEGHVFTTLIMCANVNSKRSFLLLNKMVTSCEHFFFRQCLRQKKKIKGRLLCLR